MNKLVDSESLGKFKELMDEKLKNKVSKKKKEYIIIGKAIKPKACEIGNVENWYVFKDCMLVNLSDGFEINPDTGKILLECYINGILTSEDNFVNLVYYFRFPTEGTCKYKVSSYEYNKDTYTLKLYLIKEKVPDTIKGTSQTREYVNGNGIVNKECNIDSALIYLNNKIESVGSDYYFKISYNSYIYDIERKQIFVRSRNFRQNLKDGLRKHFKVRFGRIPSHSRTFHSGLYRIRKRIGHKKTRWSYVYLRVHYKSFNEEPFYITYTEK